MHDHSDQINVHRRRRRRRHGRHHVPSCLQHSFLVDPFSFPTPYVCVRTGPAHRRAGTEYFRVMRVRQHDCRSPSIGLTL